LLSSIFVERTPMNSNLCWTLFADLLPEPERTIRDNPLFFAIAGVFAVGAVVAFAILLLKIMRGPKQGDEDAKE
jgi:hypothetical protein